MADFTDKQKQFCKEYVVDLNATQAALRAGYSEKTARQIGQRLLTKVDIQAEIQRLKKLRASKVEVTADFVLKQLVDIATTNITDVVNVINRPISMEDGSVINVPYLAVKNTEELTEAQKSAIASIKQGKNGLEIKMHDKVTTLKLIGDHLGMFAAQRDAAVETESDGFIEALKEGAKTWQE